MQAFTARRAIHQACTGADVTGEIPSAALLPGYVPKDGRSAAHASQELLPYRAMCFGWAGCLDAPDLMPAGSVRPVNISQEIGGYGYEGNVSRVVER